ATATLAGGIAHDFNNLMTGVLGNAEMLKMDLADQEDQVDQPDRHDRIEMLAAISDSARRAAKLTQQLLAYARGGKYQPQVVDLNGIVQMILQAQARIAPSEIHVEVDAASDLWYIEADSAQMSEVVFNLFTNAVEAIESSGRIDIATGNRVVNEGEVADLEPGRYVCLSVRDTGRGMSEEAQSRLFEPFFTTKFQGRGMGLAAAYGIVTNHGGHIRVESEKGCGATFEVYLPAIRTESAASPVEQPPHSQPVVATRQIKPVAEVLTILVIEDDETVRKLTTRLIGRFGYRALVARNGKEAVDIARSFEGDIHLALLDMGMPVMGGAETYPLLVAARPGIKVIIYSGYELDAAAQALLDAGASAFIQKPFQIGVLEAEIRKALAE
ncbi:MAG: response regulator, partial [Anaerolineae bacterium]|nr:response regulator [Anaerolineae bacterium]